ncbi:hypothetical protein JW930_04905 [Candidatus Woesearchaeota archaeon]|nr:hypothetical protein [Candidatus Woesearchaeota archaeon]
MKNITIKKNSEILKVCPYKGGECGWSPSNKCSCSIGTSESNGDVVYVSGTVHYANDPFPDHLPIQIFICKQHRASVSTELSHYPVVQNHLFNISVNVSSKCRGVDEAKVYLNDVQNLLAQKECDPPCREIQVEMTDFAYDGYGPAQILVHARYFGVLYTDYIYPFTVEENHLSITYPDPSDLSGYIPLSQGDVFYNKTIAVDDDQDPVTFSCMECLGSYNYTGNIITSQYYDGAWFADILWHVPVVASGLFCARIVADDGYCGDACPFVEYKFEVGNFEGNHPPVINTPSINTSYVGVPFSQHIEAYDQDNDTLAFNINPVGIGLMPPNMDISSDTGLLTWENPSIAYNGTQILVIVTDTMANDSLIFTLNIEEQIIGVCNPGDQDFCCPEGCCDPMGVRTCQENGLWGECNNYEIIDTNSNPWHCGDCENNCFSHFQVASATCNNGLCQYTCNQGYKDCNSVINGCEVNSASDPNNCGACGNICEYANANGLCLNAQCRMGSCRGNYKDANKNPNDGCECEVTNQGIELCDGKDNNCDGLIDEDCFCEDGAEKQCGTDIGECQKGTSICSDNQWGQCQNSIQPLDEICDDKDNDCDGQTDENCFCDNGMQKSCLPGDGCSKGLQHCVNNRWGGCMSLCEAHWVEITLNSPDKEVYNQTKILVDFTTSIPVTCSYKLNTNNQWPISSIPFYIQAHPGLNILTITCLNNEVQKTIVVDVATKLPKNQTYLEGMKINISEIINKIRSSNLSQEEKEFEINKILLLLNNSMDTFDFKTLIDWFQDKTRITSIFTPKNELNDTTLYLEIPKCLADHLDEIEFREGNYKVIQDDPLIAWHFINIKDQVDLSYEVKGYIEPECLEQINALPISKYIGNEIRVKPTYSIWVPIALIFIIVILYVYFKNYSSSHVLDTKESYESSIERYIIKRVKRIKKEYPDWSKEKIKKMLYTEGLSDNVVEEIMRRLP